MIQEIYKGAAANDKTGTTARAGADIINLNFAYLDAKVNNSDHVVTLGTSSLVGQDLTIHAGWVWQIAGVNYTNPADVVINFPFSASGSQRLDRIVFNTSNTFTKIAGTESVSNPVATPAPVDTIDFGITLVTDGTVGDPSIPIEGGSYVKKMESQDFIASYGATTVVDRLDLIDDRSSVSLTGAITDVKSIQLSGEFIRPGKPFFLKNRTGHDVKLWHLAGTGNIKIFFPNAADLLIKNNEVVHFNMNANDSSAVRIEFVGLDVYKEESSNKKTTIVGNEASDFFYGSIKSWITYLKDTWLSSLATKVTITDTTMFPVEDEADSNKAKVVSWLNIKNTIKTFLDAIFQAKDNQVEISANSNVLNAWHGQTVLFTANCTITVPTSLNSSLMFPFRTLTGVTVTWAITSPHVWETTPTVTPEKTVGHFMKRGSTNTIMLDV